MSAVISSLKEWRCYLEGMPFKIVTDYRPNTYLDNATSPHTLRRRARWLDISCGYDYEWEYRPGCSNVADPISRAPQHFPAFRARLHGLYTRSELSCCASLGLPGRDADTAKRPSCSAGSSDFEGGSDTPNAAADPMVQQWLVPDLQHACDLSPSTLAVARILNPEEGVHQFFESNFFARVAEAHAGDSSVSESRRTALNLRKDTRGLWWTPDECLYVPDVDTLRKECFESVHMHPYSGHYGNMRTLAKAKTIFYWPNMARDIESWCSTCDSCQRVKAQRQKAQGKLQPLQIPGRRWGSVSMDLITDLPCTSNGNDSIWVVVDRLSKMVHLVALKKTCTAESLAAVYEREVFRLHGIQESIVSDCDVRFTSRFWRALQERFKTKLHMSTKFHPQTDGQTENANGVLEDTLRHFVGPFQSDWGDRLPVVEFAMNNAVVDQ